MNINEGINLVSTSANSTSSEVGFLKSNLNILLILNTICSIINFSLCSLMIVLYYKHRKLRNSLTKMVLFIMIAEVIYSIGKFMSVVRIFLPDNDFGEATCITQGFLVIIGQYSCFLWILYIGQSLFNLLINHDTDVCTNVRYKVIFFFGLPIIFSIILLLCHEIGSSPNSLVIWCWVRSKDSDGTYNIMLIVMYGILIFFDLINLIQVFRLNYNLKKVCIKTEELSGAIQKVSRYVIRVPIICSICYSFGLTNRLIQLFVSNEIFTFIMYLIHIPTLNLKGAMFFLFCLDREYRECVCDMIPFLHKKETIQDEQISASEKSEETTNIHCGNVLLLSTRKNSFTKDTL
jgi:hypothetical protein